jgi:glutamate synthase (NADPH/NADH) small chain
MDCGVPFCHFGCPLGNLIPEWNDLVWRGKLADAIERMHATNNFPEFTGRVCPAPCEAACVLGLIEPPVTIRNIEMGISDGEFTEALIPQKPARLTGFTVAVVGSGPAGLACAQQLTRAGHTVVVYERADAVGGLLRYGIPDFKLEKHLIDRRMAQMEAEGTRFRTSTNIGTDITWADLQRRYDAVVVAIGSTVPIDLKVPGRELHGIHFAMDYLTPANQKVAAYQPPSVDTTQPSVEEASTMPSRNHDPNGSTHPSVDSITGRLSSYEVAPVPELRSSSLSIGSESESKLSIRSPQSASETTAPNANGKNVVIIGGGDTGSDCLGTALRQGAKSVTTLQVFDQPPADRPAHQPWPTMPLVFKLSSSHEEGGSVEYLANTVEFVSDGNGHVSGLKVARTEFGEGGSIGAEAGSERLIPAELVLLAIGFQHPDTAALTSQLSVDLTARGNVARTPNFVAQATESDSVRHSAARVAGSQNLAAHGADSPGSLGAAQTPLRHSAARIAGSQNLAEAEGGRSGLFVCGDAGRGQSLVVWAIAEGRSCAASVDAYLQGSTELPSPIRATTAPLTLAS